MIEKRKSRGDWNEEREVPTSIDHLDQAGFRLMEERKERNEKYRTDQTVLLMNEKRKNA